MAVKEVGQTNPGAPHSITDTDMELLGTDLLAFLSSSTGAPELVGTATRKDDA